MQGFNIALRWGLLSIIAFGFVLLSTMPTIATTALLLPRDNSIEAVVTISPLGVQNSASGTGFFTNDKGYVVTAAHVLCSNANPDPAEMYSVRLEEDGAMLDAEMIKFDLDLDLAVLKVITGDEPTPYVEIVANPMLRLGTGVSLIGFPQAGFGNAITSFGHIGGLEGIADYDACGRSVTLQGVFDVNINGTPGNSGGPLIVEDVILRRQTVVGIAVASGEGLAKVVPSDDFLAFLPEEALPPNSEGPILKVVCPENDVCDQVRLQEALENAVDGTIIELTGRFGNIELTIDKAVTIRSENATSPAILMGTQSEPVIHVRGSTHGVVLENLIVTAGGPGILVTDDARVRIDSDFSPIARPNMGGSQVTDNRLSGIRIQDRAVAEIINTNVSLNGPVTAFELSGTGIEVSDEANVTILDSIVGAYRVAGIVIRGTGTFLIDGNRIHNVEARGDGMLDEGGATIFLGEHVHGVISNNNIFESVYGIKIGTADERDGETINVEITNNSIAGSSQCSIQLAAVNEDVTVNLSGNSFSNPSPVARDLCGF